MKQKFLPLLFAMLAFFSARAADLPVASDEEKEVWYLIQFLNGNNVLEAQARYTLDVSLMDNYEKIQLSVDQLRQLLNI